MKTSRHEAAMRRRSLKAGKVILNASRIEGMLIRKLMRKASQRTARTKNLWGGALKIENLRDLQFRATTSSRKMKVKKTRVTALMAPVTPYSVKYMRSRRGEITAGITIMSGKTSLLKMDSFGSLGGLSIMSGSEGDTPRARAGSPSVARFM